MRPLFTPDGDTAARRTARRVLQAEADAVLGVLGRLDASFDAAVDALATASGRIVLTGMGKSGLVARKVAATLSSTGTPAMFVHPAEAAHGDLGGVVPGDVVVCASTTGETEEVVRLLPTLRQVASRVIALCASRDSALGRAADIFLDVSIAAEACPLGLAPTASTTATLAMGDALAMAVAERKGFTAEDFGRLHPGGTLGRRFLKASDLMHGGDAMPRVRPETPMRAVIQEMTAKNLGMTTVVQEDLLVGVITDGDLRRLLERVPQPLDLPAHEVMSRHPRTCPPDLLAARAIDLMEGPPRRITSLIVVDDAGHALGVLRLHDILQPGRP